MAQKNNSLFQQLMAEAPFGSSYHVTEGKYFGGPVSGHGEQDYYFECGCGARHSVNSAFAVRDQRGTNRIIFSCPSNDRILTLVQHEVNWLGKSKGIETLVSYYSEDSEDVYSQIFAFERMKANGFSTLQEKFDAERQGQY